MDLRHLRYFLAVAEEGHFGRAAARLNIVQPALSMQIKALEEELGGALFIRTSRRVELTAAGVLLQTEARRTLEQADHARLTVERAIRGETGRVRVGFAGNAIFSGKLTADLRRFHQRFPDAELMIQETGPQDQVDAILAGQLDIGYTPAHSNTEHPDIAATGLGLALVPAPLQQVHIPGLVYRPLNEPDLSANLVIIGRRHEPSETVKAFLKLSG